MKCFVNCWIVAVLLVGPNAVLAGCYQTTTYLKAAAPAYVAPTYQPAVSVYLVPAVPVFSVGPGYVAPALPPATAPAAAASPCSKEIESIRAEFKLLREENQFLKSMLQRQTAPVPQAQPVPQQQPAAPAAKAPAPGDLSWLTGTNGCAACHGGPEPVKGIDYSKGLDGLSAKQLMLTIRNLDQGKMPPEDPKAYEKRGIAGPHPKPTRDQLEALSARLEAMKQ